jgi:hypothetical protein
MVVQIQHLVTLASVTGMWYYCKIYLVVVLEISQITESAGMVVIGGATYTDKFEVIGNVKANAFLVVVHY